MQPNQKFDQDATLDFKIFALGYEVLVQELGTYVISVAYHSHTTCCHFSVAIDQLIGFFNVFKWKDKITVKDSLSGNIFHPAYSNK